jgi:6-phosphogluconolactonase
VGAPELRVVDDPVRECADLLLAAVSADGDVALAGGSTPKAVYELGAGEPAAWAGARLWFGDERCVPPEDPRSNFRMVKEALLDPLAQASVAVDCRRIPGERGPEVAALAYQRELEDAAGPGGVRFDLVLLGVGPDGHTASMFPGQQSLSERSRLVVGVPEAGLEPFVPRVTFTFPALARAARVVVLATGDGKADAIARAFGPDALPVTEVPSSLLAEYVPSLIVLLDAAAASRL